MSRSTVPAPASAWKAVSTSSGRLAGQRSPDAAGPGRSGDRLVRSILQDADPTVDELVKHL
jgi:hypothetical protein